MRTHDARWTHRTAVVLIPPESVWEPIQAIRRRHDRQVQRWMPHVTLLYPFAPRDELPQHAPALEDAVRSIAPFALELRSFQLFRHRGQSSTIWLAPEPVDTLRTLQAALVQAAPDYAHTSRFSGGFTPHLSVGQSGGAEEAEALRRELQAVWTPVRTEIREIQIIAREGDQPFEVVRTLPLGG